MSFIFFSSLAVIFYTFIGYGVLLYLLVKMKAIFNHKYLDSTENSDTNSSLPSCAVLIAAYNEEDIIKQKISNTFQLIYPSHLLKIYIIADGSSDKTVEAVSEFHGITLLYDP